MTTAFNGRPHFARAFAARSSPRNDATAFICRALAPGENVGTCAAEVDAAFVHNILVCECVPGCSGERFPDLSELCLWQYQLQ
jgi:hypothetical protein